MIARIPASQFVVLGVEVALENAGTVSFFVRNVATQHTFGMQFLLGSAEALPTFVPGAREAHKALRDFLWSQWESGDPVFWYAGVPLTPVP